MKPEEIVRQALLIHMTEELGYPKSLIAVEREISFVSQAHTGRIPKRRLDILCFQKGSGQALLLIECKAIALTPKVIEQVLGYNHYIKAPFVAVANQDHVVLGMWKSSSNTYVFYPKLPSYKELIEML